MANPNKTYEQSYRLGYMFDQIENILLIRDVIIIGERNFQVNGYTIDLECDWVEV